MKIYFLTYGDKNFYLSKKHLISLAKKSEFFDYTLSLGPSDLNSDFKKKFEIILKEKRGGGYWIWKHEIISSLLDTLNDGDIVVYCDAGASINITPRSRNRFNEYILQINDSLHSSLRMECEPGFIEKYYTYHEIFDYFNLNPNSEEGNSLQLQAGHMFFKKSKHSEEFFKEYKLMLDRNPEFITDELSEDNQINKFCENRHDQSIFSLLSKAMGSEIISNETEFRKRPSEQYNFPFLSVRAHSHGPKDYAKFLLNPKKFTENTVYFQ